MKILHILSELDSGGVAKLLFDYCSRMPDIDFDFVVTSNKIGMVEEKIKNMGCRVFHIAKIREGFRKHNMQLKDIIRNGNYDVVHDHGDYKGWISLFIAKRQGVKVRIIHSHRSKAYSLKDRLQKKIFTPLAKRYATDLFSCGMLAGKWAWNKSHFVIMKNGIDSSLYLYKQQTRKQISDSLSLNDAFVIGSVGRLSKQKNTIYILKIFLEVIKINPKTKLLLIGDGELKNDVSFFIEKEHLDDKVICLGKVNNVYDYLNAFDVYVLPSLWEGLPISLIEAEMNGLTSFVSTNVTDEISFNTNVYYLDVSDGERKWAEKICAAKSERVVIDDRIKEYDIKECALWLDKYYLDAVKRTSSNE